MNKERVIELINAVDKAIYRYDCQYVFEDGVCYDNSGVYDVEPVALRVDVENFIDQLTMDCTEYLNKKNFQAARNCIPVLEKLNDLLSELDAQ